MVNAIKWDGAPTFGTAFSSAAIADGAGGLGGANDNDVDLDRWASFYFSINPDVSPGTGTSLKCYLLCSDDSGTTWERGGTGTQPERAPDFVVPVAALNSAHEVMVQRVALPPLDFKLLIWNDTGQQATVSATMAPYNEEIQ